MRIRKATSDDAAFIAAHAHRMLDFKLPDWRANEKDIMVNADINHLTKALQPVTKMMLCLLQKMNQISR